MSNYRNSVFFIGPALYLLGRYKIPVSSEYVPYYVNQLTLEAVDLLTLNTTASKNDTLHNKLADFRIYFIRVLTRLNFGGFLARLPPHYPPSGGLRSPLLWRPSSASYPTTGGGRRSPSPRRLRRLHRSLAQVRLQPVSCDDLGSASDVHLEGLLPPGDDPVRSRVER